jgi:hypothetical protein
VAAIANLIFCTPYKTNIAMLAHIAEVPIDHRKREFVVHRNQLRLPLSAKAIFSRPPASRSRLHLPVPLPHEGDNHRVPCIPHPPVPQRWHQYSIHEANSSPRLSNWLLMLFVGTAVTDEVLLDRISYQSGRAGSLLIRRIFCIVKFRDR